MAPKRADPLERLAEFEAVLHLLAALLERLLVEGSHLDAEFLLHRQRGAETRSERPCADKADSCSVNDHMNHS